MRFFDAWHARQDQADFGAVELVAEIFQCGVGQPFGFVHDDKLYLSVPRTHELDVL